MVFVFIFVIIVVGFLLMGGMSLIMKFFNIGEDVQMGKQVKELERAVYSDKTKSGIYWTATGSTDVFQFDVGGNLERVCFVDPKNPDENPDGNWFDVFDVYIELMRDKVIEKIHDPGKNIGYFKKSGEHPFVGYFLEKLKPYTNEEDGIDNGNFCITETTDLLLTNEGGFVSVRLNPS